MKLLKWAVIVFVALGVLFLLFGEVEDTQEAVDAVSEKETAKEPKEEVEKREPEEKKQAEENVLTLQEDLLAYIDSSEGVILDIYPNKHTNSYNQMEIVVDGNVWELSTNTDKISFSESMHNAIAGSIYEHGVLERGDTVNITVLDESGYELAKQSIWTGKFEIYR